MADINQLKEETYDRLASLSEQINTSKGFGMMGLLEQEQQQRQQQAAPMQQDPPATAPAASEPKLTEILEPINSSLRAFSETTAREIGSIRNELSSLRQPVQPQVEAPVSDDPYAQKLNQIESQMVKTRLDTAWERARNSMNAARGKYGNDFDFSENDLRSVWQQHIGNNVNAAEGTNWDLYMEQQYASRRAPKLEARLKDLEAELQRQKQEKVDPTLAMSQSPRANRNGAPPQVPGTGVNEFDEDVYRRASERMGKRIGSFAGFNRLLVDEQNKKLLRTAS